MRILVDYRPALRARTGVGEYIHELVRAYTAAHPDEVTVFTSSWKDRPAPSTAADLRAPVIDRHLPVAALNYLWHRLEWPSIEAIAGAFDVVHAAHPLLIPSRRAARVVTVDFSADVSSDVPALPGVKTLGRSARQWTLEVSEPLGPLLHALAGLPVHDLQVEAFRLEDYISQMYGIEVRS